MKPSIKSSHVKPLEKKPDQKSIRRKQMEKILAVWEKFPSLRLAQLLGNATNLQDIYYVTDEELVQKVTEYGQAQDDRPPVNIPNERKFPRECC